MSSGTNPFPRTYLAVTLLVIFTLLQPSCQGATTNVTYPHIGLSAGLNETMATFDYLQFEFYVAQSLNCTAEQVAVSVFSPTLVDSLILVDFVFVQIKPTQPSPDALADSFYSNFTTLQPLASKFKVLSVIYDPTIEVPQRVYDAGSGTGYRLPTRSGITGFIGMMVIMGLMVLCTIVFIIFYLVRGRHDTSLLSTPAALQAPATNVCMWILGASEWVSNFARQGRVPIKHVSSVACGGSHVLVVAHGVLYVGGGNSQGQLGLGHCREMHSLVPNKSFDEQVIAKVCCGEDFSVVVTADGELFTFGSGQEGALGHGNNANKALPTKVMAFEDRTVIGIAAGSYHVVALCDDGLYAFGWNDHGQLMTGDNVSSNIPMRVSLFAGYESTIRDLCCGVNHTIILCGDWELYGCGGNECGQLGLGHYEDVWEPTLIPLAETSNYVYSVSSWFHTIVACDDGVYACGEGDGYRLGTGTEDYCPSLTWIEGTGAYDVRFVVAGNEHSMFVTSSYEVLVCGRSTGGKLGVGERVITVPSLLKLPGVLDTKHTIPSDSGLPTLTLLVGGPTFTVVLMPFIKSQRLARALARKNKNLVVQEEDEADSGEEAVPETSDDEDDTDLMEVSGRSGGRRSAHGSSEPYGSVAPNGPPPTDPHRGKSQRSWKGHSTNVKRGGWD